MTLKRKLKMAFSDMFDYIMMMNSRNNEVKKFKDKRRISIFSKIVLTKEQKKAIDRLYVENYGKKIPYTWHRHYTAFTGNFDPYYFPELLFIPEFEHFMNGNDNYTKTFEDKNVLPILAKAAGVCMPETIYSCVNGLIQDSEHNIVSIKQLYTLEGECFIKPSVDSCSGVGCQVLNLQNGIDILTGNSIKNIITAKGNNWVIQKRIKCHESIAKIYPDSVNTFRIMTYIWKNEICVAPVIMRIGQGGANVDNAHAGGMFIAIDNDGSLHDKAFTEFNLTFDEHPDTHLTYKGYKIPLFPNVLKAAIRCHSFLPQVGCINWDFSIDEMGNPILIEANIRGGGIWVFEMAHGTGVFGDKTPEILQWIRSMEHTKKSRRE